MLGWLLLLGGVSILVMATRIATRRGRGVTQGVAVILVVAGGLLVLRHAGTGLLPGHGPRRWGAP